MPRRGHFRAMTVAKQGLVLCDMIDHGMIDVVISTGALMAHGLWKRRE